MIENHILKNNGTKDEAKDIFQNTLLAFYKNIQKPDFAINVKISTYLFSIAKNLWLKELREKTKFTTEELTEDKEIEDKGDYSQKEELIYRMTAGVKKLSENCQKLIRLYYYESKSWKEITQQMDYKNEHAARNQKYKCFQKLKQNVA